MRSGRPQETGTAHAAAGRPAGAEAREHELNALRGALERSERRAHEYLHWLRIASDDGRVGLWQRDLATGAVSMDASTRAIVGWPPDGVPPTAEQYHELVLPEDRARFALSRATFPAPGDTDEVEYRVRRPDGDIRRVVTRRSVQYGADGAPLVMFGALIDVTERWRTEHALREANQRLQLAADSAGLGLWDWDLGTGALRIEGRVRQMLGVGEDWLPTPENWVARIHPEDRALTRQAYDEAFVPGRRHAVVEYRVLLPDRGVRHVFETISMEPGPDGWPRRVFGATLDVSEMQQARQELAALAERLQLATATARIGIWEWRAPGPTEVWDARMREIYGIRDPGFSPSREQWMARVHPNDRARVLASCSAHMRRGGAGELEYRIVRSDGEVRLIDDRMIVMRDEHGEVTRMLGTQLDITELRLAEDALRAKEAAERANRAKTEFLSRMSHELRTPLNAVLGFTQVLALDRAHPLAPAQAERVSQIQTAGWHLLELINEILELSCIEAGSIRLARTVVSLAPLVDECVELLAAQVAARALEVQVERGAGGAVWGDRTRVKQVLLNLLSNAIKYNREGGSIRIGIAAAGGEASVTIADSGHGMSEAQVKQLFEPFNRLGLENGRIEGTGIGLSIAHKLVGLMGGRIEVASQPGVGSRFRVVLKEAADAAGGVPQHAEGAEPRLRDDVSGSVLYVEDEPANAAVVRQILSLRPQVRLLTACDGASAWVLAAVCQPDLMLIDMRLPDTDGAELRQRLRERPETANIVCIALSAGALPQDAERARAAGFADYWTKPIDAALLLRGIDEVLIAQRGPLPPTRAACATG